MAARIHVNRLAEWPEFEDLAEPIRRAVTGALRSRVPEPGGEVSVTFCSVDEIRELNRRYLGRDLPTDVLAFQLGDPEALLGDVYIAPAEGRRNAEERGLSAREEILRLVVHGTLHLLGLDHPEDETRHDSPLFRLQEELLRGLADE